MINDISTGFEYVENIKTIRSKLEYYLRNNHQKSVLVTSALENEGKSTFAVNIALSLGQTGAKVLLVDFDLKKPSIYKIFEINKRDEISIKDVLKNQNLVDKKIHKNVEGIDLLINSESFNDSELLIDNESTSLLFNKLYTMYDYIIVDSAPVLVAEDTLVLSNRLDTTLFVTRQNYGKVQYINDAIDLVKEINGNLIGCVLTRAFRLPLSRAAGYGGYYNYRENHYHRLFKESQAKIEKNNGEGKNA